MVVYTNNPSTWEAEAGGSEDCELRGQPGAESKLKAGGQSTHLLLCKARTGLLHLVRSTNFSSPLQDK
jgi:hypothetical protein